MYKALVFDLGKVVFDLSFDRVFQSWATSSGKPADAIKKRFRFDILFRQSERNEISPEYFRKALLQKMGIQLSDAEFDAGWCDLYLDAYPGIDELLDNLKQQYRLVALTNTNEIHEPVWRTRYADTLTRFEKIFTSHEMGTRKPEVLSYRLVLEYLGCEPGEVLFLDDNEENTGGAEDLGIDTILVSSFEQMKDELRQKGVLK